MTGVCCSGRRTSARSCGLWLERVWASSWRGGGAGFACRRRSAERGPPEERSWPARFGVGEVPRPLHSVGVWGGMPFLREESGCGSLGSLPGACCGFAAWALWLRWRSGSGRGTVCMALRGVGGSGGDGVLWSRWTCFLRWRLPCAQGAWLRAFSCGFGWGGLGRAEALCCGGLLTPRAWRGWRRFWRCWGSCCWRRGSLSAFR